MAAFCPKCGKEIRPEGKFCGSCGHKLTSPGQPPEAVSTPSASQGVQEQVDIDPDPTPTPLPAIILDTNILGRPTSSPPGENTCPHCSVPNKEGVTFCAHCGKSISVPTAAPPAEEPEIKRKPRFVVAAFYLGVILLIIISLVGIAWGFRLTDFFTPTATPLP